MSEKTSKNVLLIFIKNPELGQVKTRLAESVGDKKAFRIYNRLLKITKSVTDKLLCTRQVWYSNYIDDEDIWSSGQYEKKMQKGRDLGERMKESFRQAFTDGYKKAVVIGSDCPSITSHIIERAFRALDDNEVVIGPSGDGGYYLLGTTDFYPDLFTGINWSTSSVYEQTISRIKSLDLSMHTLPERTDIDTAEDLRRSQISEEKL